MSVVDNITEEFNVAILHGTSTCAACGKEGNSSDMNTCNKCKSVKYCNAACKKKHRSKHKKACERRAAELFEEALFKEPPPPEDCPLCFLSLPRADRTTFKSCCGKRICDGCIYAIQMSEGKDICAFCREPPPVSNEDLIQQLKKLMDRGNAEAFHLLACYYADGSIGLTQNRQKANELFLKAGELGSAEAYYTLGNAYRLATGVEVDMNKAQHFYELAAMGGNVHARHNLANMEGMASYKCRASKHWMIAAKAGLEVSLDFVKKGFRDRMISKDEYANTLRAYQKWNDEVKSDERDKAEQARLLGLL